MLSFVSVWLLLIVFIACCIWILKCWLMSPCSIHIFIWIMILIYKHFWVASFTSLLEIGEQKLIFFIKTEAIQKSSFHYQSLTWNKNIFQNCECKSVQENLFAKQFFEQCMICMGYALFASFIEGWMCNWNVILEYVHQMS